MAPSHYLNQCWNIVNWPLMNKLQWNFNRNSYIFIQENTFERVVSEMVAMLSRPQCVKCQEICSHSGIPAEDIHIFILNWTISTFSFWISILLLLWCKNENISSISPNVFFLCTVQSKLHNSFAAMALWKNTEIIIFLYDRKNKHCHHVQ